MLSNFYPCGLRVFDTEFKSSEQAYQWRFAQHTGITCIADKIMAARSAADAKDIAARIPRELQRDWHSVKRDAMREILHAKADCCPLFKRTLLESNGKRLVESTQDVYWASGLSPRDTASTHPSYYPGSNHLGRILEQVRSELLREASKLQKINTERHDDVISSAAGDPAAKSTASPKPVHSTSSGGISSDASNSATATYPGTSTPTAQDDLGTSTATAVSDDSDHECEELDMSSIEELIDGSDTDTVTEPAAEVPTKKSTENPPQKSQSQPPKLSRRVERSSDLQPTKTAASGSLFSSLKRKLTPGKATDNCQESKIQLGDDSNS